MNIFRYMFEYFINNKHLPLSGHFSSALTKNMKETKGRKINQNGLVTVHNQSVLV